LQKSTKPAQAYASRLSACIILADIGDLPSAPCLLYGYGAYGVTISADFETDIFSLVNRDFIYAIAHIRGGEDKGFAWYENGKHRYKAIRSQISLRSSAIW